MRLWSRRWPRVTVGIVAALLLVALSTCWRLGIWSVRDYQLYVYFVSRYSFGEDLWHGRIRQGQSVEELMRLAPPHETDQYGGFTSLSYYPGGPLPPNHLPFEGVEFVARDGRLVSARAASCTWDRKFFDMTAADTEEYDRLRKEVIEERYLRAREQAGPESQSPRGSP